MLDLTDQLIAEVGHDLIAQVAPEEMPLFRLHSEAYFKDPAKALQPPAGKDERLGFGAGEVVAFLTPIVLAVTSAVVTFLVEEVRKSIKEESADLISKVVKQLFNKCRSGQSELQFPRLTPEQLDLVRQRAYDKAFQLGLPEEKARLLADAIVGQLTIASNQS